MQSYPKRAAENAPILQEGSNFHKKTVKQILPPKLQNVRFKMQNMFTIF